MKGKCEGNCEGNHAGKTVRGNVVEKGRMYERGGVCEGGKGMGERMRREKRMRGGYESEKGGGVSDFLHQMSLGMANV